MTTRPGTTPLPQRRQILLVEDSSQVRQVLARALEAENYAVHQAEHGQAGLALLKRITPDLILSDINMPRMNGIEFYKAVRQNPAWVPIPFVFLTANDSAEDIQAGRELGVEDYLTKPIEGDDLVRIVNARLLRVANVQVAQIGQAYLDTVTMLANAIEGRDPYTRGHVERVTAYALRMAEAMRWPPDHIRNLEFGARLHDIGKIIVPDQILKKAGPLSDEEWALMKQHPTAGAKIVGGIAHLQGTLPYILYHHEHWSGGGYPRGLTGQEIPIEGRVLALADVYDALTTVRPYHPARSPAEVGQFMTLKAGALFDPSLVPVFLDVMGLNNKKA
ncbi:MAG: response regulator [Chloroflexi bacterium]|nr:response regulator [Chloroflexota bacterium]